MADRGKKFEYDPNFKGPLNKRSCTDVFCLLIFIVFVICWSFVSYYAIRNGDIEKIINPTSSEGRKCGIDSEVKNKSYLMFFNLNKCLSLTSCFAETVCQEKCPNENFIYINLRDPALLETMKSKMICKTEVDLSIVTSWNQLDNLVDNNKCARWYLKSELVLKRCLPLMVWEQYSNFTMGQESLNKAKYVIQTLAEIEKIIRFTLEDINTTWKVIIPIVVGSGLMAIIHIILLKCLALPFIYLSILVICGVLSYGIYAMNNEYSASKSSTALTGLITFSILLSFVVICTLCIRKRIYLACQLLNESSTAVTSILSTLIFPIFPWMMQLLVIAFSITVALFLTSVGIPIYQIEEVTAGKCMCPDNLGYTDKSECDPTIFNDECKEEGGHCISAGCHLVGFERPWFIKYMHGVNVFAIFWLFFFVSALSQMILAATFACWYWTFHKKDVPFFALTVSMWRTFRYHLGTVAFGSLIVGICSLIRNILNWCSKKIKSYGSNPYITMILTCCKCLFWILERFLKYINRNAYIMCAIHGKSFCQSARDAFNLLVRNVVRVVVLDKITEWLLLLGKLYITCLAAFITWLFYDKYQIQKVNHWAIPVILVVVGSFLITSIFFSVYSSAVETLFLCFLEDSERNDGSETRPYYMRRRLRKLLHR